MNRTTIIHRYLKPQLRIHHPPQTRWQSTLPIVQIKEATFYRQYPSATATKDGDDASTRAETPVFRDVTFSLPNNLDAGAQEHWAVVSPASLARTTFLQVLNNQYLSIPPTARSYPFLSSGDIKDAHLRSPERAIKYVGFDAERGGLGGTSLQGAYLSARYEARKEETDWSLQDYLEGNTELNALERTGEELVDAKLLQRVIHDLRLADLLSRPVSNLSNGQTRRARIAKSLLSKPELLLLDGPFMGLDPSTVDMISALLKDMAEKHRPRLVLSLRPEDHVPHWISHLVYINSNLDILAQGTKKHVFDEVSRPINRWPVDAAALRKMQDASEATSPPASDSTDAVTRDGFPQIDPSPARGEPILEMDGVVVSYGPLDSPTRTTVLGNWQQQEAETPGLHWSVHRNQRWGIFGPNGSGKTTLLSLITSDHPQTYSLPIKLFGRSRLPGPGEAGISIFDLQKRIGHSSPEVHTFFPKHLPVRRVLESAWADAPLAKPQLNRQNDIIVDAVLRWFTPELNPRAEPIMQHLTTLWRKGHLKTARTKRRETLDKEEATKKIEKLSAHSDDLDWADTVTFRDLSFSQQRLLLFLRAIIASPDLVILDEAFSGMDETVRDKALLFLSHGEKTEWVASRKAKKEPVTWSIEPSVISICDAVRFGGLSEEQALLVISHSREDVPGCVREWICLPEPGEGRPARWGSLPGPLELNPQGWSEIWGKTS